MSQTVTSATPCDVIDAAMPGCLVDFAAVRAVSAAVLAVSAVVRAVSVVVRAVSAVVRAFSTDRNSSNR